MPVPVSDAGSVAVHCIIQQYEECNYFIDVQKVHFNKAINI